MRYQAHPYSCGAAAVVNAIRSFGKRVSEMKVRSFSHTTKEEGTDEHGIIAALRGLGYDGRTFEATKFEEAFFDLTINLMEGCPVIIATMNMQHWVTAVGYLGDPRRIIIVDPTNTKQNKAENGVHVLSKAALMKIWQSRDGKYFGICCGKK